jgi:hypothetical protein
MTQWASSLITILAVVVGASLQYWFSQISASREKFGLLRTNAYVDFLRAMAEVGIAQKSKNMEQERRGFTLMLDAKARIAVYGSSNVVNTLANFWRLGASLDTPERIKALIILCQTIRMESNPKSDPITDEDISQFLIGS